MPICAKCGKPNNGDWEGKYCPPCNTPNAQAGAMLVKVADVKVGERFRVDYKNMTELATSINQYGLMQYPVIDQDMNLIAGGRRFLACTQFMRDIGQENWTSIPVIMKKNIDELKLREMELEENLQREALSWQEEVNLKNEILKIKQRIHGVKGQGSSKQGVSQSDVAKMMDESPNNFIRDIRLAQAMEVVPELSNAKTKDEAHKLMKQIYEKLITNELSERLQNECENLPKTSILCRVDESFIIEDAISSLSNMESGQPISLFNVDTPYAINLNKVKKTHSGVEIVEQDYKEWEDDEYRTNCTIIAQELYRIAPEHTWLTWWFAEQWQDWLKSTLLDAGWDVRPVPCVWYAEGPAQTNQPQDSLANTYEPFFLCSKGRPIIQKPGRVNVFRYPKVYAQKKIHKTQKPVELMVDIYETFTRKGDKIYSAFLGSGVDIEAGILTNRNVFGRDLNSEVKKRFLNNIAAKYRE